VGSPRTGVSWRRWIRLVTGAGCVAVLLCVALCVLRRDGERTRLRAALREIVPTLTPERGALLREAGSALDALLQQFPDNGQTLEATASFYRGVGRTADAVHCWQRVLELEPDLGAKAHAAIAAVAQKKGELTEAAEHYRRALAQEPDSTVYAVQLAEVLIARDQLADAVELLEGVLQERPRVMPAAVLLGEAYLRQREYAKARQHLEAGIKLGPDYTNAYYGLATACRSLGDQEKAAEYLQKFKELKARDAQTHRDVLKASGETDQFQAVLARTFTAIAQAYLAHGDYQQAEAHLRRAAALSPTEVEPRMLLAWLREQQGRPDEAVALLTLVRDSARGDVGAQLTVATAFTRLGQFEEAERTFHRVIELSPHEAAAYAALASLYYASGRKLEEARQLLQQAVSLDADARYYVQLAAVCRKIGDAAGARAAAEQAAKRDAGVARRAP
jgi:tetratricopeptide (TPR) repeat protein